MNKTGIKICGLQSVEVLKSMVNLPVDYIGFVFADSKRRIDGVQAGELLRVLDEWTSGSRPRSVGVFVNPGDALLNDVMEKAPLDVIQLHGQESPQRCREIRERFGIQVFKAWSVDSQGQLERSADELDAYVGTIDALLLDTYDPCMVAAPEKRLRGINSCLSGLDSSTWNPFVCSRRADCR